MIRLINSLERKNIKVTEINKWGPFLRREWENIFVNHINESEKRKTYID
jgi:hypothetical protein